MCSFTRLYQATTDETIVQAVAGVVEVTGEEVREKWGLSELESGYIEYNEYLEYNEYNEFRNKRIDSP